VRKCGLDSSGYRWSPMATFSKRSHFTDALFLEKTVVYIFWAANWLSIVFPSPDYQTKNK
jgi:hypothetical protein